MVPVIPVNLSIYPCIYDSFVCYSEALFLREYKFTAIFLKNYTFYCYKVSILSHFMF